MLIYFIFFNTHIRSKHNENKHKTVKGIPKAGCSNVELIPTIASTSKIIICTKYIPKLHLLITENCFENIFLLIKTSLTKTKTAIDIDTTAILK